ncbi:UDP-N-acetylglucosamine 2-epimerase (non-hydrolyzing) [bacterium]|nr:MAG: UDP-N-acetylglucosamine 2-epimerase (non-hydrolyzing) [bacterium]
MIVTILGARPQFVKAAVVSKAFTEKGIKETIIHTGQHYDHAMSGVFWDELGIPAPEINLHVGSGLHGKQTGAMLEQIEAYLVAHQQEITALMVYGDTNSTLAGALAASKLHIPVIHVEAGLRSFNRTMPEEVNRVLTDHISDLLFCSSDVGVNQLATEGVTKGVYNVGDVMFDALLTFSEIAKTKVKLADVITFAEGEFLLATIHRPANTDSPENLNQILEAFKAIEKPIVWPVHPRNKARLSSMNLPKNLHLVEPQPYFNMITLLDSCETVLTDSGGLQKEAYWKGKPCITLRDETEWVETLENGWNQLTGAHKDKIVNAYHTKPTAEWKPIYGDGKAAEKIVDVVKVLSHNL